MREEGRRPQLLISPLGSLGKESRVGSRTGVPVNSCTFGAQRVDKRGWRSHLHGAGAAWRRCL